MKDHIFCGEDRIAFRTTRKEDCQPTSFPMMQNGTMSFTLPPLSIETVIMERKR